MPPLALYVHVPFCQTKCPYCDFNTYAGIESLMPSYVGAVEHEAAQWGAWLGRPRLTSKAARNRRARRIHTTIPYLLSVGYPTIA